MIKLYIDIAMLMAGLIALACVKWLESSEPRISPEKGGARHWTRKLAKACSDYLKPGGRK